MTQTKSKKRKSSSLSAGQVIFSVCSALVLVLSLFFSDELLAQMQKGMKLCVSTVIPSLFPFAALSELLIRSGATNVVAKIFGPAFEKIFGIRREGAIALVLGLICGFPIGTRCAITLYERAKIDKYELERLFAFCNGPSSAFLIGAVGTTLFGSRKLGLLLCAAELISCFAIGLLTRWFYDCKGKGEFFLCNACERTAPKISDEITGSITSAARSMIYICAFVIFFSSFTGMIETCLDLLHIPKILRVLCIGFFEMTSGALAASELPIPLSCLILSAMIGWSGMSVHFQFISLCGEHKVRLWRYFGAKLCRAAIDCLLLFAGLRIFGDTLELRIGAAESFLASGTVDIFAIISLVIFSFGAVRVARREKY
jgi:sporulation integral membrane protein YlbJ